MLSGIDVSTHSRPKAAGRDETSSIPVCSQFQHTAARRRLGHAYRLASSVGCGFNTQPPEGGWPDFIPAFDFLLRFNTQPPEGGWVIGLAVDDGEPVSTHSRPKAAGASLKSLAPSGFAAPISLSSQEKREREYNTAFSVTPAFAIILIVKEQFQFSNPAAFS